MNVRTLLACCWAIADLGTAQAATMDFLQHPASADALNGMIAVDASTIRDIDLDGIPVLKIWFENGHGKIQSNLFIDTAGEGTLPSRAFEERHWSKDELPDMHYTIIGVIPRASDAEVAPVPVPGAALLFGSGLIGLLALRFKRRP